MPTRDARTGALLLGVALALTASPAVAGTEAPVDSTVATPPGQAVQPSQQQDGTPRLRLTDPSRLGEGSNGPALHGDDFSFGLSVLNEGQESEEFVLTFTLPPELTLISLRSPNSVATCSGNVCRGTLPAGASIENQIFASVEGRARLSSSFRGDTTMIRADLQEGANPDPNQRTRTLFVAVSPPAGQQPAAGAQSSGTGTGTGMTTLPRTGDRTTITALLGQCLLLLGAIAQLAGTRRPALHSR